jgi:hypothetical protein
MQGIYQLCPGGLWPLSSRRTAGSGQLAWPTKHCAGDQIAHAASANRSWAATGRNWLSPVPTSAPCRQEDECLPILSQFENSPQQRSLRRRSWSSGEAEAVSIFRGGKGALFRGISVVKTSITSPAHSTRIQPDGAPDLGHFRLSFGGRDRKAGTHASLLSHPQPFHRNPRPRREKTRARRTAIAVRILPSPAAALLLAFLGTLRSTACPLPRHQFEGGKPHPGPPRPCPSAIPLYPREDT